jgi:thiol-disulfide isomerase/thioredoxin
MKFKSVALSVLALALTGSGMQDGFERERGGANGSAKDALEGNAPPELAGQWFNSGGKSIDWKALSGKVVVLDFWAHWCGPCRESVPHIKVLLERYREQGLVVIGIHSDANKEKMLEVSRSLGMVWPILFDPEKKYMKALSADSYPDYYLIDRKGVLRFADLANKEVDRAVEMLLAEKP